MSRATRTLAQLLLGVAAWEASGAQVAVRATRRDTVVAAATVTVAFMVSNAGGDSVRVAPVLRAPEGWPVLVDAEPMPLPAGGGGMAVLSVAVPARVRAGVYVVALAARGVADSVAVRVPARRVLDVAVSERPAYVISGRAYDATFLVRNRGNIAGAVRVRARSALGRATIGESLLRLDAGQASVVRVRVATPPGFASAQDDVLELAAAHDSAGEQAVVGSARVTIVPEPSRDVDAYQRVPAQVNVRAASSDAVSRFEAFGRGLLRDGGTSEVDFLVRGPTGPYSAFGERDEYRIGVRAPSWRLRLGDDIYMASGLTGAAQPGFGAALDGTRGIFRAGAWGQQFRRIPQKGTELGASLGARGSRGTRGSLNLVSRDGGILPGTIASATAGLARDAFSADLEIARSAGDSGSGLARSARVSGAAGAYAFDAGHQAADTAFSGAMRGASHTYLTANAQWTESLSFALNGGRHRSDISRLAGVPYLETLDIVTLGATLLNRFTVQGGAVERGTEVSGARRRGAQRSVRLRGDQATRLGELGIEAELGVGRDGDGPRRTFTDVSLGARHALAQGGVGLWVDRYSGGSLTRGWDGAVTAGGDATLRFARGTDVTLIGYATRLSVSGAPWQSQADALVTHALANGSRVSLRARLVGGATSTAQQSVAYLEYGMPLRLPVSRLRTPGRVTGRVVDAASGRGVAGALVRLGPQAAVTNRDGSVSFGGVPAGEHRLSMSQETAFADAVFLGDPTVVVDGARAQPTTFHVALARSATVDVSVRRFAVARTGVSGAADSLVDAGPLANATLVLAGERDTLYRATRDDGRATFTDVPPGSWTISVHGDAPAFHRFDPDRIALTLAPGETRALEVRLVPRKREVQLIGGEELKNEAADPRRAPASAPGAARTGRPEESGTPSR